MAINLTRSNAIVKNKNATWYVPYLNGFALETITPRPYVKQILYKMTLVPSNKDFSFRSLTFDTQKQYKYNENQDKIKHIDYIS